MNIFKFTKKSHPVTYRGAKMDSTLEGIWAAFFDIRCIDWDYAPLVGLKAWEPDFAITMKENPNVQRLAEVRPHISLEGWKTDVDKLAAIQASFSKDFEIVLLGNSPLYPANFVVSGINPNEAPKYEEVAIGETLHFEGPLDFGPKEKLLADWTEARNIIRKLSRPKEWYSND